LGSTDRAARNRQLALSSAAINGGTSGTAFTQSLPTAVTAKTTNATMTRALVQ
jgi:hypothetical protein